MKTKAEISKAGVIDLLEKEIPISQIADLYKTSEAAIQEILGQILQDDLRQELLAEAAMRDAGAGRPFPSMRLLESFDRFEPSSELQDWATRVFLTPGGPLYNPVHSHLVLAIPCFVWTTLPYRKGDQVVAGLAEMLGQKSSSWPKGRADQQLTDWFGMVPQFLITLHAEIAASMNDVNFCALVEHELYHCGQAVDSFGSPAFTDEGLPRYRLRRHDVEEFVDIVGRYGPGAGAGRTADLVRVGSRPPSVGAASIAQACGSCR